MMQSWKTYQNQIKSAARIGKVKFAVIFLVVGLILLKAYTIAVWAMSSPQQNEMFDRFVEPVWNGSEQLNLLIGPDMIAGIDTNNATLKYYRIDEDGLSDLSIYLKNSKVYLDGYLIIDDETKIEKLGSQIFHGLIFNSIETNLSRLQLLKLWWQMRADITITAQNSPVLREENIVDERIKVKLLNGTSVSGLAQDSAGWIENLGAEVIELGNSSRQSNSSQILVYHVGKEELQTIKRLEDIFRVAASYVTDPTPQRADVQVMIGRDFLR